MTDLPLDHVAIAVPDLEEASMSYQRLTGVSGSPVETLEAQGVRVSFHGSIELLEPLGPDTTVGRFLSRRGPGLHHVGFRTEDLAAEIERLIGEGFETIEDPRVGARGHLVAFLHPRTTGKVLVELVQT